MQADCYTKTVPRPSIVPFGDLQLALLPVACVFGRGAIMRQPEAQPYSETTTVAIGSDRHWPMRRAFMRMLTACIFAKGIPRRRLLRCCAYRLGPRIWEHWISARRSHQHYLSDRCYQAECNSTIDDDAYICDLSRLKSEVRRQDSSFFIPYLVLTQGK